MTELEKMVWAATYAAVFAREWSDVRLAHWSGRTIDHIGGFACAEVADVAVTKLRQALASDDGRYLTIVTEQSKNGDGQ